VGIAWSMAWTREIGHILFVFVLSFMLTSGHLFFSLAARMAEAQKAVYFKIKRT
jgi:hypothetical protein